MCAAPGPGGSGGGAGGGGQRQSRICLSASKIPTSFKLVSTSFINFFLKFFSKFETFSEFAGQNLDLQRRITVSVVY